MKNEPKHWREHFPIPDKDDHKYKRGQVAVLGGLEMTGAACLSAHAASRIGAGLVTIISPKVSAAQKLFGYDPVYTYRAFKPHIIVNNQTSLLDFYHKAKQKGQVCSVIGPGLGNKNYKAVRSLVMSMMEEYAPMVLDADALNAFEDHQDDLLLKAHNNVVLTPHEGEFEKIFPKYLNDLKEDRLKTVSNIALDKKIVVVLKGHRTIIASPFGSVSVNEDASHYLATAGSGDVLSGLIAGLIAQGMDAYHASCAAVWIHGKSSEILGAGMVAGDLIEKIPEVLKEMLGIQKKVG